MGGNSLLENPKPHNTDDKLHQVGHAKRREELSDMFESSSGLAAGNRRCHFKNRPMTI